MMSFIGAAQRGQAYAPGWFLANNGDCTRETRQIARTGAETGENGRKYVKTGTVYPANDETAEGVVYENVDVTTGDMPGSVVTKGEVYEDRLPVAITEAAKTALTGKGFTFKAAPAVTRPY